jgi:phytoene desaturase
MTVLAQMMPSNARRAVPHLGSGIDWSVRAVPFRKLIAARLSEELLPNLEQNVVTSRVMTPQDFQRLYLVGAGTHPGAGMSGVLSSARVLDTLVPRGSSFA